MRNAERIVEPDVLPPEAVEEVAPEPPTRGVVAPVLCMVLALLAAWLVLTLLGVIGDGAPV